MKQKGDVKLTNDIFGHGVSESHQYRQQSTRKNVSTKPRHDWRCMKVNGNATISGQKCTYLDPIQVNLVNNTTNRHHHLRDKLLRGAHIKVSKLHWITWIAIAHLRKFRPYLKRYRKQREQWQSVLREKSMKKHVLEYESGQSLVLTIPQNKDMGPPADIVAVRFTSQFGNTAIVENAKPACTIKLTSRVNSCL